MPPAATGATPATGPPLPPGCFLLGEAEPNQPVVEPVVVKGRHRHHGPAPLPRQVPGKGPGIFPQKLAYKQYDASFPT